jgi:hypothetical protein
MHTQSHWIPAFAGMTGNQFPASIPFLVAPAKAGAQRLSRSPIHPRPLLSFACERSKCLPRS